MKKYKVECFYKNSQSYIVTADSADEACEVAHHEHFLNMGMQGIGECSSKGEVIKHLTYESDSTKTATWNELSE